MEVRASMLRSERMVLRCQTQTTKVTITFKIKKKVSYGHRIGVLGESLGKWSPDKALLLEWEAGDQWVSAPVEVEREVPLEFKLGILCNGKVVEWQPGPNSIIDWQRVEKPTSETLTVEAFWEGAMQLQSQEDLRGQTQEKAAIDPDSYNEARQLVEDRDGAEPVAPQPDSLPATAPHTSIPPTSDAHGAKSSIAVAESNVPSTDLREIGTAEMSGELVGTLRQAAMPAQRAGRQSVEAGQPKVRGSDGETTMVPSASGASPPRARTGRATAKAVNPWNTIGNPEEAPIAASNLKVAQLKEELKKLGLPTSGRKHDLVVRLEAARKTPP